MPDSAWTPSLDDAELDDLSERLRTAVRTALPQLVKNALEGATSGLARHVDIHQPPGLALRLELTEMRTVVRDRRPVLEVRFRGIVRCPDPHSGKPLDVPVDGACRLDLDSGAIVHLDL